MTTEDRKVNTVERIAAALERVAPAWAYEQAERELRERNSVPLEEITSPEMLHVQIDALLRSARALAAEREG